MLMKRRYICLLVVMFLAGSLTLLAQRGGGAGGRGGAAAGVTRQRRVLRFVNTDVFDHLDSVLEAILQECESRKAPHPDPLP